MSAPTLVYRTAVIKAQPLYECELCGACAYGSTVNIGLEFPAGTEEQLTGSLRTFSVSNTHMPEGWVGYGREAHRCPECKS